MPVSVKAAIDLIPVFRTPWLPSSRYPQVTSRFWMPLPPVIIVSPLHFIFPPMPFCSFSYMLWKHSYMLWKHSLSALHSGLCLHACVYLHEDGYVLLHVKAKLSVFLSHVRPYLCVWTDLSLNLEFKDTGSMAGQGTPGIHMRLLQTPATAASFSHGCWKTYKSLYSKHSTTEPSLLSPLRHFNLCKVCIITLVSLTPAFLRKPNPTPACAIVLPT